MTTAQGTTVTKDFILKEQLINIMIIFNTQNNGYVVIYGIEKKIQSDKRLFV